MPNVIGRRELIAGFGSAAVAWPMATTAQQRTVQRPGSKRIAVVVAAGKVANMRDDPNGAVFFDEMKRHGYVEGENLIVERYSAEGQHERYTDVAREAVSTQPDVIVSYGMAMSARLKALTNTIPIVAFTGGT